MSKEVSCKRISKAASCKANAASASFRLFNSAVRASSRRSMVGVVTLRLLQTIAQNGAAEPPAGQNRRGGPHEHSISVGNDGPWRGRPGSRMGMVGNPIHHAECSHGETTSR